MKNSKKLMFQLTLTKYICQNTSLIRALASICFIHFIVEKELLYWMQGHYYIADTCH